MQTEPVITETKPRPDIASILLIVGVVVFVAIVAFLGYQGYAVSQQVKATQSERASLQGKYDALVQERDSFISDLDTTNTDVEQARVDLEAVRQELATEQANLAKVQEEQKTLESNMDLAWKYLDITYGYFVDEVSTSTLDKKVEAIGDNDLTKKFERWREDKSNSSRWLSWIVYMLATATDLLTLD